MWDRFAQRLFIVKLTACEDKLATLPIKEQSFVKDMRNKYRTREDAESLGIRLWEPSVKQLNYLTSIADTL